MSALRIRLEPGQRGELTRRAEAAGYHGDVSAWTRSLWGLEPTAPVSGHRPVPAETRARLAELAAAGVSQARIARELHLSPSTVRRLLAE